ncbi:DUF4270 domain-containing protein [Flavobacterium sp. F-65]|uniref:DUF4270 domain-containing protein n=1 Tax=Flavobacterium pisciphilum TaxID=2893755 RepID=A0ABS8MW58_9FLAO|nr:DUF4270 family protein [Flavobacterium sp. F-65]MCC9073009.1 DUF4270 domain-containing protein [Flavobacterium sp. F-65]
MYKLLLLLFLGFFVVSCNTDADAGEFVVGSDYLSIGNKVILIDTLTVDMSTINFDSLVTSSQNRILLGNYDDPIFGKVKSDSYLQLLANDYKLNIEDSDTNLPNYVYDSIAMILKYDNYFFGDTTQIQTLDIHRLTQKVKPNKEDKNFYNNSTLTYAPESLGMISYKPRPTEKDSINIRMNDAFGSELFQKLKKREVVNLDEFTEYLKGIVLTSTGASSSSVIGFKGATSVVRLYYSKYQGDAETSLVKDFSILDATKQFNAITLDKTGTIIQNLPISSSKLSSSQTENKGFIQSGTGIACRIDFPNIKQLKYIAEKGAIVDAVLFIKPVANTYSKIYPLADSLRVYVGDNLNRISGTLNNSSGTAMYALLNKASDEFNENVGYKISIGGFLQKEMLKQSDSKSSLILTLPNINKAVNRIVLGDQKFPSNKMELKIYYITY